MTWLHDLNQHLRQLFHLNTSGVPKFRETSEQVLLVPLTLVARAKALV